ncbi:MAG: hypothetical protein E6R08_04060 [Nevskiaceae bacterium]|nr:MAG: hypothetical protein E6R08_04060 [Nevskiaceae bacterium]
MTARPTLSIAYIQQAVAASYGMDVRMLISPRRAKKLVRPRQVAMWLSANLLPERSLVAIGKAFGKRDHSTVMHSIRRVDMLSDADPAFFENLRSIRGRIIEATAPDAATHVPVEQQATEIAATFTKAAVALAAANPEIAARTFRRISFSFQPAQPTGDKP